MNIQPKFHHNTQKERQSTSFIYVYYIILFCIYSFDFGCWYCCFTAVCSIFNSLLICLSVSFLSASVFCRLSLYFSLPLSLSVYLSMYYVEIVHRYVYYIILRTNKIDSKLFVSLFSNGCLFLLSRYRQCECGRLQFHSYHLFPFVKILSNVFY